MLLRYTLKRILFALPLLLGITVVVFVILHLAPVNPVGAQGDFNTRVQPEYFRELRALYGLDKPFYAQYWEWLGRLARLDLGNSFRDHQPVLDRILQALPATLLLNFLALGLVYGIALPLGIYSALRVNSAWDRGFTLFSFLAFSVPTFVLALVLQMIFGSVLGWFPITGFRSPWMEDLPWWRQGLNILWHLVLPVAVSAFGSWVATSRYMRNSFLEVLAQDYIRTARAKGLPAKAVVLRHALPNALLPIITLLGLSFPALIGGGIIIETIFGWPGMGRLGYEAAINFDYPLVMGITLMGAFLTVLGNLMADIAYAVIDPRVRYDAGK